jgi:hypothetical protein
VTPNPAAPRRRRRARLPTPGASEAERVIFSAWREDDLLNYALSTGRMLGWRVYHTRYSLRSSAGFPDLVAVHAGQGRVLYAELKREGLWPTEGRIGAGGRWVDGQREWLADLHDAGDEVYLWWPSDSRDIATIFSYGASPEMPCVARLGTYLAETTDDPGPQI